MDIFGVAISALKPALDDDFVDRANYYYTPSTLLFFAMIISTRQWIGQPIECWVPTEFSHAWEEYTENYCYIQDTYWLPIDQPVIATPYLLQKRISYYQWVPFILAAQALLFSMPFGLWRLFSFRSGFNVDTVVSVAKDCALAGRRVDEIGKLAMLTGFIRNVLCTRMAFGSRPAEMSWFSRLAYRNDFLTIIYTLVKVLYILNAALQLFLLEKLLSTGGRMEAGVFIPLLAGVDWHRSGSFPRVTLCSFEVRLLGNVNRYTVQCVLMINMFIEKMFLIIWCWVFILLSLNIGHVLFWFLRLLPGRRCGHVGRLLMIHSQDDDSICRETMHRFVRFFLGADGLLLVTKVSYHAGDVVASHLVYGLFQQFAAAGRVKSEKIPSSTLSFKSLLATDNLADV